MSMHKILLDACRVKLACVWVHSIPIKLELVKVTIGQPVYVNIYV